MKPANVPQGPEVPVLKDGKGGGVGREAGAQRADNSNPGRGLTRPLYSTGKLPRLKEGGLDSGDFEGPHVVVV